MYIGSKEVNTINDGVVLFVDGTQQKITPRQEEYLLTQEPKDLSELQTLVMDNLMPDVWKVIEANENAKETTIALANTFEQHNVSIVEVQKVIDLITAQRIERYNTLMKERLWDEIEKFHTDMAFLKEVCQTISDSHKRIICLAVWKALGTYVEGEPFEEARDNIRLSHIKPFI